MTKIWYLSHMPGWLKLGLWPMNQRIGALSVVKIFIHVSMVAFAIQIYTVYTSSALKNIPQLSSGHWQFKQALWFFLAQWKSLRNVLAAFASQSSFFVTHYCCGVSRAEALYTQKWPRLGCLLDMPKSRITMGWFTITLFLELTCACQRPVSFVNHGGFASSCLFLTKHRKTHNFLIFS